MSYNIPPSVERAIISQFRATIGDYLLPDETSVKAAQAAAEYAASQVRLVAALWGTTEFDRAVRVARDNIALKAGLLADGQMDERNSAANASIRASLLMAVRIAVAIAAA